MRILLIEDDRNLSDTLTYQLKHEGYPTDQCFDGEDAFYYISQNIYDLILLDWMLPHKNGLTILKEMRDSSYDIPVIFLTALGELDQKIMGFDAGADDYLVKPFSEKELFARIRAIERRPRKVQEIDKISFSDISYEPSTHLLSGSLSECTLSQKEGFLLECLLRNGEKVFAREALLIKVWGPDAEIEDGNLDNYMYFLRRRLSTVSSHLRIKTHRGIGYSLEEYYA